MKFEPGNAGNPCFQLACELSNPANYFEGRGERIAETLPHNLLLFGRRSGEQLVNFTIRAHHHRLVLICALQGSGEICIDDQTVALGEGAATLIFPFQFHAYLKIRPSRILWLFITFELDDLTQLERLRGNETHSLAGVEMTLIAEMIREWKNSKSAQLPQLYLAALLQRMIASRPSEAMGRKSRRLEGREINLLTRINRSILHDLDQGRTVSVKELSRKVGISESQLRIKFRQVTRLSLGRHLRDLQMRRAVSLLQSANTSVTEVAERCGFGSIYSFSRAFKEAWKVSPRAYRKARGIV